MVKRAQEFARSCKEYGVLEDSYRILSFRLIERTIFESLLWLEDSE